MHVMDMPFVDNNKEWNRTIGGNGNITDEQCNEVIDYYRQFKLNEESEKKAVLSHTFKNAVLAVNAVLSALKAEGFEVKDVFIKYENSRSITALFMVDDEVFCSDKFNEAYNIAQDIEQKFKDDISDVTINFSRKTESFDVDVLACEGFYLRKKTL